LDASGSKGNRVFRSFGSPRQMGDITTPAGQEFRASPIAYGVDVDGLIERLSHPDILERILPLDVRVEQLLPSMSKPKKIVRSSGPWIT